ncbi:MAG: S8 family serine peptidase [Nanoarchaeota archaeon]
MKVSDKNLVLILILVFLVSLIFTIFAFSNTLITNSQSGELKLINENFLKNASLEDIDIIAEKNEKNKKINMDEIDDEIIDFETNLKANSEIIESLETTSKKINHPYSGYVIEFDNPSLIEYQMNKENEQNEKTSLIQSVSYRAQLNLEHLDTKTLIENQLGKSLTEIITNEFFLTFNGIALDISDEEAKLLENLPGIKNIEPDYETHALLNESVPLIGADLIWQMDAEGNNCSSSTFECLTGKGVTIGIIDTGIDYTHRDLGNCTEEQFLSKSCSKVIDGWDFINNDNNPLDDHGHGTHVAGIAAGKGDYNDNNVFDINESWGVAPDATLVAYKVLDKRATGHMSIIAAGIERSVDPNQDGDTSDHLDIISISIGGYGNPDDSVSKAINNAVDAGVIAVVAAGNSGPEGNDYCRNDDDGRFNSICSPATSRKAITVAASYKKDYAWIGWDGNVVTDQITGFSSFGPVAWTTENGADYLIKPDITAPGAVICSALRPGFVPWYEDTTYKKCLDNYHVNLAGTSMAAPHVSGTAALLKQKNPDWTNYEVKNALKLSAKDVGYDKFRQGVGRIQSNVSIEINSIPITEITTSGSVSGKINITGSAYGNDFVYYKLKYGRGLNPTRWKNIGKSFNPIINGNLYTNFNTEKLSNSIYTLRLEAVTNNGDKVIEDSIIAVKNSNNMVCSDFNECRLLSFIPNVIINTDKDIFGKGDSFFINQPNTTLDCHGNKIVFDSPNSYIYVYANYTTIKNCVVENAQEFVHAENANNLVFVDNIIYNSPSGFHFVSVSNATFIKNKIYGTGTSAFTFQDSYSGYSIDKSNKVNDKPVLYLDGLNNTTFENLDLGSLIVTNSNNLTFKNINVSDADTITISESSNITILDSESSRNKYGIRLIRSSENIIKNNEFIDENGIGILTFYADKNKIINNTIKSGGPGLYALSLINSEVAENQIYESGSGIFLDAYSNLTIRDNLMQNNTYGIFFLMYGGQIIEKNKIYHNSIFNSTQYNIVAIWPGIGTFISSDITDLYISFGRQGNFWGHSTLPYFCRQIGAGCPKADTLNSGIYDNCPYNQSYSPGKWPESPVCLTKPEIINSTIPSVLIANQTGVFKWQAYDEADDSLTWNISWGDETNSLSPDICLDDKCWNVSITHIWESPGLYNITVSLFDGTNTIVSKYPIEILAKDTIKPAILSFSPRTNNTIYGVPQTVTFTCSAYDNYGLSKVILWGDWPISNNPSRTYKEIETKYIDGTAATVTFTTTITTNGTFAWNCQVFDKNNNYEWINLKGYSPYFTLVSSKCSDGTISDMCSINKPGYCSNGFLVNDCSRCGCSGDMICKSSGICSKPTGEQPFPIE